MVDPQANVLLVKDYSPYGEVLSSTGKYQTAFDYTGEMVDGTGLVYLRARYYDPVTGRFFAREPFAGFLIQPASQNGYSYVLNNPILYTDPSGRIIPLVAAGIGAIIGAGAVASLIGAFAWEAFIPIAETYIGTGLIGNMAAGAATGIVAGQFGRTTSNILYGKPVQEILADIANPNDVLLDAGLGAVFSGVGYLCKGILTNAKQLSDKTTTSINTVDVPEHSHH